MMNDYIISCESTADLSDEHFKERGVQYVSFSFMIDGESYKDDYGKSMDIHEFYSRMKAGSITSTSQVSVAEYEELWRPILSEGRDVFHLTLATGISGTYNSACVAAAELREEFPDRKIYVTDSLNASSGFGLLVDMACDKRDEGASIEELSSYILSIRDKCNAWFFTDDLTYLFRGGRVSRTSFVLGTALKVCPLLRINQAGGLVPAAKLRGTKKVIEACAKKMIERAEGGSSYDGYCYISHSEADEEVEELKAILNEHFKNIKGGIKVFDIGTVIGSHTGPGTVALFFMGKEKEA